MVLASTIYAQPVMRRSPGYQEVLFTDTKEQAVHRLSATLQSVESQIKNAGATPIFCTICPGSLHDWNHKRYQDRVTSHLLHTEEYPAMQQELNQAIVEINNKIRSINSANGIFTPRIADTIVKNPGKNKAPRFHFSRLKDGVHPPMALKKKWAGLILEAIEQNRRNPLPPRMELPSTESDTDDEQPSGAHRRPWRLS